MKRYAWLAAALFSAASLTGCSGMAEAVFSSDNGYSMTENLIYYVMEEIGIIEDTGMGTEESLVNDAETKAESIQVEESKTESENSSPAHSSSESEEESSPEAEKELCKLPTVQSVTDSDILNVKTSYEYDHFWKENCPSVRLQCEQVTVSDEGYEELKKALEVYNTETWFNIQPMYQELVQFAQEGLQSAATELFIEREIEVTRADSRIFSFIDDESSYTGGAHGSYYKSTRTFDAQTGKALQLSDVVTDYDRVYQMVLEDLNRHYIKDAFFPDYEETLHDMFYRKEGVAASPVEWSMGTDGITFWFSQYVIGSWASGPFRAEIPYTGNEELFADAYVPPVYAAGTIRKIGEGERFTVKSGPEGKPMDLCYYLQYMNSNEEMNLSIRTYEKEYGNQIEQYTQDFYGTCEAVYFTELANGAAYLYAEYGTDNDHRETHVINLNGRSGNQPAFSDVGIAPGDIYGYFVADAGTLRLYGHTYTLGTYRVYQDCHVGEDGIPVPDEAMMTITPYDGSEPVTITSARELKVWVHGANETKTETVLPAGTVFQPYRTDGETMMEMKLKDGRICDLPLERIEDEYGFLINGVSEYECFEMLPYAG